MVEEKKNAGTLEFLKAEKKKKGWGGRKRLGVEGEFYRKKENDSCFHSSGFSISHP